MKKTTIKMFAMFGGKLKSETPMRLELAKKIWNVYLKPTLLTGLNALTVGGKAMKLLRDYEATVLRASTPLPTDRAMVLSQSLFR